MKTSWRFLVVFMALFFSGSATDARAAELSGVRMADSQTVDGAHLTLNGLALRTASLLHLRVYVVGLYLEQPSHDANTIIDSSGTKLLRFVFLRNVDAMKARNSWRKAFVRNCQEPCKLPVTEVAQFLSRVPAMHKGDIADVLFDARGIDFRVNGRSLGEVTDSNFAHVILLCYVGPHATPAAVKDGVLGLR